MRALGIHILVELKDCNHEILKSLNMIREFMIEAAREARVTILDTIFHEFDPFGVTGIIAIAESHISIHTWPEYNYAAVDIFTCGEEMKPYIAAQILIERLESKNPSIIEIKRGILDTDAQVAAPT